MKIELKLEVAPKTARRVAAVGATLILIGTGALVYANQIQFTSGQTLTAADLNNNFDELYARTVATKNGTSMTINGTLCGATADTYDGAQVGGFAGAKAKCEAACGAPTAHMCSEEELGRSLQLGISTASAAGAWMYSGNLAANTGSGIQSACEGWTTTGATTCCSYTYGPTWGDTFGLVGTAPCFELRSIACCN